LPWAQPNNTFIIINRGIDKIAIYESDLVRVEDTKWFLVMVFQNASLRPPSLAPALDAGADRESDRPRDAVTAGMRVLLPFCSYFTLSLLPKLCLLAALSLVDRFPSLRLAGLAAVVYKLAPTAL